MIEEFGNLICNWSSWLVSIWEETSPTSHYTFSSEINKIINYKNTAIKVLGLPWKYSVLTGWTSSPLAPIRHSQGTGVATDDKVICFFFLVVALAAVFFPSELRTVLGHFILVASGFFLYCLQKSSSSFSLKEKLLWGGRWQLREKTLVLCPWGAAIKYDRVVSTSISSPAVSDPRGLVSLSSFLTIDMII